MSLLRKLQAQPLHRKMIILWFGVAVCGVILVGIWVGIGTYKPNAKGDVSIFKQLGDGFKKVGKEDFVQKAKQQTAQDQINQQLNQQQK